MKFRHFDGKHIEDIATYVDEYVNEKENKGYIHELFIGTDSKVRKRGLVTYVSVVALYKKGKGVHILYRKLKKDKIFGMYQKLWTEVELSVELAEYLKTNSVFAKNNVSEIHLDININKKHKSNSILEAATGYVTAMGYTFKVKSQAWVATVAADMLCRR